MHRVFAQQNNQMIALRCLLKRTAKDFTQGRMKLLSMGGLLAAFTAF